MRTSGDSSFGTLQCYVSVDIRVQTSLSLNKKCRSHLLFLGRAPINTMSPWKMVNMGLMPSPQHGRASSQHQRASSHHSRHVGWGGGRNLDDDDIIGALAAVPMIDDNNEPAPENLPSPEDLIMLSNSIMGSWSHSGICQWKSMIHYNANPELTFWTLSLSDPSKLNLFERLFFRHSSKQQSFPR